MRITKPLRLCLLYRPFRWRRQKRLSVCIVACLRKDGDNFVALPELTMLKDILPTLDADEILDFIMPKQHPEFLISGHAYTRFQADKTACMVRARVGSKQKEALVFGARYWIDGKSTQPESFDAQSLSWENSYGGAGFDANPAGRGIHSEQIEGMAMVSLPALEHPQRRLNHPGQNIPPINFGPIPVDWPHRMQKAGTFDQQWLETEGSGFFDDMNPSMFNAAQDDQIWQDREELKSGETFELWNMHPLQQRWAGTIPDLRARCFVRRRGSKTQDLDEIAMLPTTLWFVPDHDSILMMFHGSIEIEDDDAYDIANIMPALEKTGQARPLSHYQKLLDVRTDHDSAALHVFRDEELIPEDMKAPWMEDMSAEQENEMLAKVSRTQYQGYGGDTVDERYNRFVGPKKFTTLGDLPEIFERNQWVEEQVLEDGRKEKERSLAMLRAERRNADHMIDGRTLDFMEKMLDPDTDTDTPLTIPLSGPPRQRNLKRAAGASGPRTGLGADRKALDEVMEKIAQTGMPDAAAASRKFYLHGVHYQERAPRMTSARSRRIRREIERRLSQALPLNRLDLTGADLSGMDLSGQDFSEAWLESANLTGANLSSCRFFETVLAGADLSEARLDGADFDTANISGAVFQNTTAIGARFHAVIMATQTRLAHSDFSKSGFSEINASDLEISACRFQEAQFDNCNFENGNFAESDFSRARIVKGGYDKCKFDRLILDGSDWRNTVFVGTRLEQVRLTGASMLKTSWVMGSCIVRSSLIHMRMRESSMREMDVREVDFSDSHWMQCDLSLAHLSDCHMQRMTTPQSLFVRTFFDGVDLTGSNLMHGNFQKSIFNQTQLDKCNFARADLSEIRVDESTDTNNLYLEGARKAPYHESVIRAWRTP